MAWLPFLSDVAKFALPAAACLAATATRARARLLHTAPAWAAKRRAIVGGGPGALQILMDFDRTCTTQDSESSYGVLEAARSPAIYAQARQLYETYYPIETCTTRSVEEKIPAMKEWYEKSHALLAQDGLVERDVATAVAASCVTFRPGVVEVINFSRDNDVPLLIFSAGIGNVVEALLRRLYGPLPPTVHVVSNFMQFEAGGALTGWSTPLVHMYNKDESHLRASPMYPELLRRPNVVLVGDSLGDATMADGLPHTNVLRFGLLSHKIDAFLPRYTAAFDVVLTHDAPLAPLVALLHDVAAAAPTPAPMPPS